ncbi:DUF6455 family protein [Afifella sp. IM 167]|uniref:DUF6455 family protein n=1 Tax=Afifella sp. IM 167 TaxID=2033586 RepID=UPI001CCA0A5D|nr:DUF6455 family protein [Afifella sp. IM 167]MBZ8131870.1 hypothetical protein [Afifella sp. IM 167]
MGLKKRYLENLDRMRRMMARYALQPLDVTRFFGEDETRNALGRCITCEAVCPCEAYLAEAELTEVPSFCPNLHMLQKLSATLVDAEDEASSGGGGLAAWQAVDRSDTRLGAPA